MSQNESPKKNLRQEPEMIQVWIPKKRMSRPFPLRWGIAVLFLFGLFAVVTQYQFNGIASDKIFAARLDTFHSDERAYDTAVKANADCVVAIEVRETYRRIFTGVSTLFQNSADLVVTLFPTSEEAKEYQASLTSGVDELITKPVAEGLPPKKASDCPQIPLKAPTPPTK